MKLNKSGADKQNPQEINQKAGENQPNFGSMAQQREVSNPQKKIMRSRQIDDEEMLSKKERGDAVRDLFDDLHIDDNMDDQVYAPPCDADADDDVYIIEQLSGNRNEA